MTKNKKTLPKFRSVNRLVDFFEGHDMGDYWDQMPEVSFDINLKKSTHIVAIDQDLIERLARVSKSKKIPSGQLVNAWLREKLASQELTTSPKRRTANLSHTR
jgi:hypothetical protein